MKKFTVIEIGLIGVVCLACLLILEWQYLGNIQ